MSTQTLADALAKKIETDGLSNLAAAEAIGVSLPSLRGTLKGRSFPNARTLSKWAGFLGTSPEEVKSLIEAGKANKGGRAPKAPKQPGKKAAGRPRGRRSAKGGSDIGAALAAIQAAVEAAGTILQDDLAVAVHNLPEASRKIVASVVNGL